jgi:hypothetical protein
MNGGFRSSCWTAGGGQANFALLARRNPTGSFRDPSFQSWAMRIKSMILKALQIPLFGACLVSSMVFATEGPIEQRTVAAQRYLKVQPMSDLIDKMLPTVAGRIYIRLPAEERERLTADLRRAVRMDVIEKNAESELAESFTASELDVLADLFGSVVGSSAMKKRDRYIGTMTSETLGEFQRASTCIEEAMANPGVAVCAGQPGSVVAPGSLESRAEAAEKYLKVQPVSAIVDELWPMIEMKVRKLSKEEQAHYSVLMRKLVRVDLLEQKAREELVKEFTSDELNALATLYGSADGASAMKKLHYTFSLVKTLRTELDRTAICVGPDETAKQAVNCSDIEKVH